MDERRRQHAATAWQAMRSLVTGRDDRRAEVSSTLGMSFVRVKALLRLTRTPMTMRELAAALTTDAPYTTLVVNDLESRGLVERTVHPKDHRCKVVTVTAAGRSAARTAERILNEPPAELLALPERELATLDGVLSGLLRDSGQ